MDTNRTAMEETIEREIEGMEPVASISVPAHWTVSSESPSFGRTMATISFHPPDSPGLTLSLFYRGFPISDSEAAKFRRVLAKGAHRLSVEELDAACSQIVGNLSDASAFDIQSASVEILAGEPALVVDGFWKTSDKRFHGLFIPRDVTHQEVQEIYFEGPEPGYSSHLDEALAAIASISWLKSSLLEDHTR